jgi:hypothetical protein
LNTNNFSFSAAQMKRLNRLIKFWDNKKYKFVKSKMKIMKNLKIRLSLLLLGICTSALAQHATTTSDGDALGSGGTVAYSIGQVVYTANASSSGSASQGVQQAYKINRLNINEAKPNISLSVFPNPTIDKLILQIQDFKNENLSYQLFDMQGKLISHGEVVSQYTEVNTSYLPPAGYLIYLVKENIPIQSFKIIKN